MQIFDLDLETERDTAITLRGLKMENSTVVNCIDKLDPSKMTVVQLKALEKQVDIVVCHYLLIIPRCMRREGYGSRVCVSVYLCLCICVSVCLGVCLLLH